MKVIKYFDAINNEWITLKVNNDIADELKGMHFEEKEQNRQVAKYEVSTDAYQNSENVFIDSAPNPYEALEEKEGLKELTQKEVRIMLLKKALKKLNKEERFIIKKIFWQNYKKIEISKKYNILPSLITYRYQKAISKLKKYIVENEKLGLVNN